MSDPSILGQLAIIEAFMDKDITRGEAIHDLVSLGLMALEAERIIDDLEQEA